MEVSGESRLAFGQLAGGVLCSTCRVGQREVVRIQPEVIHVLKLLSEENGTTDDSWMVSAELRGPVRGVLNRYIANLIGHRVRMHNYLGMLAS